jgi:DNA-binding transcriptional ArsR family regulator
LNGKLPQSCPPDKSQAKESSVSADRGGAPAAGGGQEPIYVAKAEFFRVLGHPARVRILELLRDGEMSVGELQAELRLDSSGTSQHLGVLRRQGILESRKEGTSVFYRARDPRIFELLEVARRILTSSLEATQALLSELATGPAPSAPEDPRA